MSAGLAAWEIFDKHEQDDAGRLEFDDAYEFRSSDDVTLYSSINPATGLPMVGDLDVEGSPVGTSLGSDLFDFFDTDNCGSSFDD